MSALGARRVITLLAVVAGTLALVWLAWPHPDVTIVVERGGRALVMSRLGRRGPLDDTLFVGGSGARRSVRVINHDSLSHQLALFTVQPGAQTDYAVPLGTFGGYCSAHPRSKRLTIVVR